MTASIVDEGVIAHQDTVEIRGRRAEKIAFRVTITFKDEEGRTWAINKVYEAAPVLEE